MRMAVSDKQPLSAIGFWRLGKEFVQVSVGSTSSISNLNPLPKRNLYSWFHTCGDWSHLNSVRTWRHSNGSFLLVTCLNGSR